MWGRGLGFSQDGTEVCPAAHVAARKVWGGKADGLEGKGVLTVQQSIDGHAIPSAELLGTWKACLESAERRKERRSGTMKVFSFPLSALS